MFCKVDLGFTMDMDSKVGFADLDFNTRIFKDLEGFHGFGSVDFQGIGSGV
jgi:hypothetical protein